MPVSEKQEVLLEGLGLGPITPSDPEFPNPDYYLLPHQQILYVCRIRTWRRSEGRNARGRPSGETYQCLYTDIPCFLQITASNHAPQALILVEQDNIFTLDLLHTPGGIVLRSTDWFLLQSATDYWTGRTWDNVGDYWHLAGDAEGHQFFANKNTYRARNQPPPRDPAGSLLLT